MSPGNGLIGVGQRPKISEGLHIVQSSIGIPWYRGIVASRFSLDLQSTSSNGYPVFFPSSRDVTTYLGQMK